MAIRIERYHTSLQPVWDAFVKLAKNGLFMFQRNYMEYHADRFTDHSLLFYKEDELMCVLPANEKEHGFYSHGGLTYGGMLMSRRVGIVFLLEAFDVLLQYLRDCGFTNFIYKSIPYIYHQLPAQEDLYVLHRAGAQLYRRDISSVIDLSEKISYTKGTKSNLSKARKNNLRVEPSIDFGLFMAIEEEILRAKYGTKPTHTAAEIGMLASRFPAHIKLYLVYKEDTCLGGSILYETEDVIHTQYIGITSEGKDAGALDCLVDYLLHNLIEKHKYFSFGISTEQEGKVLNEGLVRNKESFGARAITNDFYRIDL